MGNFNRTVELDKAFDCYEGSKRELSDTPLYYYDLTKSEFVKIKSRMKNPGVVFINTYELCSALIDEYLNQPGMEEYKIGFQKSPRRVRGKIVGFLWFADDVGKEFEFDRFERARVERVLKKWCKSHGLDYIEPDVYSADNYPFCEE